MTTMSGPAVLWHDLPRLCRQADCIVKFHVSKWPGFGGKVNGSVYGEGQTHTVSLFGKLRPLELELLGITPTDSFLDHQHFLD